LLFESQRQLIEEMQDKLLRLRLVSFSSLSVRLQRTVRVTCDEEGKLAELTIVGENLEVDTQILDSLIEPLLHLLRNAVAHGIEPPDTRRIIGKPETGKIKVRVKSEGTHIILKISDDGRGIFAEGLKEKAVQNGLIAQDAANKMTAEEAFSLIFLAGLTTTDKISQISGRGVGMNIVKQSIERQQGTISIESETHLGTTFTLRLPMALALTRALLVKTSEQTFAFPLKLIKQACEITAAELQKAKAANSIEIGGVKYAVACLNELLGMPAPATTKSETVSVLLLETLESRFALIVDEIIKPEEIVIKPLGKPLQNSAEMLGAAILGDGSVVLVLDLVYLLNSNPANRNSKRQNTESDAELVSHKNKKDSDIQRQMSTGFEDAALKVLIVDDSPSVRHMTSNIIKNASWTAITAKDGLEALEILQDSRELPDVILTDIEMPRMDGYEFLASLKRHEKLQAIPVVMITSRANKKHRQKAFDLGVSEYLDKPFDDAKLIETIKNLTA
jgi:chemosensory pili system protein ChpA (sensor histidine kinase/response regulator)